MLGLADLASPWKEQALWARGGRDVAQLAPIGPFADSVASDKLLETGSE